MSRRLWGAIAKLLFMAIVLVTLSGCVKFNSTYRFADGHIDGKVTYQLSPEILEEYGGVYQTYNDYPQSDLDAMCMEIAGPELEEYAHESKVNNEEWLECSMVTGERTVNQFGPDNVFFTVSHDDVTANYTVNIDLSDLDEQFDGGFSSLKVIPDTEYTMTFEFKNLKTITVDGVEINSRNPHDGILREGNKATVDVLFFEEGEKIQIVGSDVAVARIMWIALSGMFLIGSGVVIGGVVWWMHHKKNNSGTVTNVPDANWRSQPDNVQPRRAANGVQNFPPPQPEQRVVSSFSQPERNMGSNPNTFDPRNTNDGGLGGYRNNDGKF